MVSNLLTWRVSLIKPGLMALRIPWRLAAPCTVLVHKLKTFWRNSGLGWKA
jgi:hypothetical protein